MKKRNWAKIFLVFLVATIIDLIVPDPVILVDEILLIALSIFSFIKKVQD